MGASMGHRQLACLCVLLTCCTGSMEAVVAHEPDLRPTGLFTDPNPHKGVPKGALRVADDVVLRRDGILQPRPGFRYDDDLAQGADPLYMIPYDGDILVIGDAASNLTEWESAGTAVQDDASNALNWDTDHARGAQARGNLYLTTQDAVRKLTSGTDTAAKRAGAPRVAMLAITQTGSGSTVLQQYGGRAYRAVIKRTDANGVVTRSAATPSFVIQRSTAGTSDTNVICYLDIETEGTATAGTPKDVIEIYRTREVVGSASNLGIPGEEFFLTHEHELTAAEVSVGSVTIADSVPDTEASAALYVNPSRQGILQNNDRPHVSKDMALFKGSLFSANTRGPNRLILRAADSAVDQTGNATGIGYRTINGDTTNGSLLVTNVASVTGLEVGMLMSGSGIQGYTRITGITGAGPYTVTMTKSATATASGVAITYHDTIRIKTGALEDIYYLAGSISSWIEFVLGVNTIFGLASNGDRSDYVRAEFSGGFISGISSNQAVLTIEERDRAGNTFEVFASHGSDYFPILPSLDSVSGYASAADTRPNGIQWSKTDQPEHVPEGNFAVIGSDKHEILRLVPTKDALFIFKTDGIWRLAGFGANAGWRIDPIDRTHKLLTPRAATVMGGEVYAWTDRGVVHVTDIGVQKGGILSKLAIGKDLRDIEKDLSKHSSATNGAWLCANEKDDELIVGVPSVVGGNNCDHMMVYNMKVRAWYKWKKAYSYMILNPADGLLYGSNNGGEYVEYERRGGSVDTADRHYSVTISNVSSTTITINGGSGWTPAVGDILDQTTDLARVTAVASATEFTVDMTGLSTGAATAYSAYESVIEWVAKTAGTPGARKHFQSVSVTWEDMINIRQFDMEFTSDIDDDADSETRVMTRSLSSTQPRSEYFVVPTDHAMVTQLWPKVKVKQAGSKWEMSGLSLNYKVLSPLVNYSESPANLVAQGGS